MSVRPPRVSGIALGNSASGPLSAQKRTSNLAESGSVGNITWVELHAAATELSKAKTAVSNVLGEAGKTGFVAMGLRPAFSAMENQLLSTALRRFGLLGALALQVASPEDSAKVLPVPHVVLAYAVHVAILNEGFVCTGTKTSDFSQTEEWPVMLPRGWMNENMTEFSFRYRHKSGPADKLSLRGTLQSEALMLCVNDPYSSSTDAVIVHLRVKDFVGSKAGDIPVIHGAKEKELLNVVQERVLGVVPGVVSLRKGTPPGTAASVAAFQAQLQAAGPVAGGMGFQTGPGGGAFASPGLQDPLTGGFRGDLMPGVGGSMLYGPGNPQFDRLYGGSSLGVPMSGGPPPGARFDPYGPLGGRGMGGPTRGGRGGFGMGGDPDPDDFPPPGGGGYFG